MVLLRPFAVAISQYPGAALSSVRVEKLATPFTAATVVVPPSVPLPGLLPSDTVTLSANVGTRFPDASSTVTCTAGANTAPAVVLAGGSTENASWRAGPGITSNSAL